jgi:hypothetical protein
MQLNIDKTQLLEKMFQAALKTKLSQLARKYDYDLVFQPWRQLVKTDGVKTYFCKWRWNPGMTLREALECLDDYFTGLDGLLQKLEERKSQRDARFDPSSASPSR